MYVHSVCFNMQHQQPIRFATIQRAHSHAQRQSYANNSGSQHVMIPRCTNKNTDNRGMSGLDGVPLHCRMLLPSPLHTTLSQPDTACVCEFETNSALPRRAGLLKACTPCHLLLMLAVAWTAALVKVSSQNPVVQNISARNGVDQFCLYGCN